MKNLFLRKRASSRQSQFLTPKDLLQRALMFGVLFLIAHLAGLREFTGILSGTLGTTSVSWTTAVLLGSTYIILYLAFVVLVPILLLGAAILAIGRRLFSKEHQEPLDYNGFGPELATKESNPGTTSAV